MELFLILAYSLQFTAGVCFMGIVFARGIKSLSKSKKEAIKENVQVTFEHSNRSMIINTKSEEIHHLRPRAYLLTDGVRALFRLHDSEEDEPSEQ